MPESGGENAGDEIDQRRFARSIRADNAEPVAARDADRKVFDDRALAIGLGQPIGLDDQFARLGGVRGRHLDLALDAPRLAPLLAHFAEFADAPHVAFAARGDAVTKPMLLHHDAPVELVTLDLLLLELLIAPGFEGGKALFEPARRAAVEPDGRARQIGEQAFVMADEHEGRPRLRQLLLQPFDGEKVEMVGRLVEQQDFRRRRQGAHERGAARLAARERRRPGGRRQRPAPPSARARDADRLPRRGRRGRNPEPSRMPIDRALARDSAGSRRAGRTELPPSGSISPAAILSSVDLPDPLRPTSAMRSLGATASSAPSSRGWPPSVRRTSRNCRTGGI